MVTVKEEKEKKSMSKIKKVLAVFLTLAMVLGMGMTTLAAGNTATIKLSGGELLDGATIKYKQIVEPDRESTIGWKFSGNYAETFKRAFQVNTEEEALNKLIALGGDENAKTGTINASSELGEALAALKGEATETKGVENSTITGLTSAGLYLVVAEKQGYTYLPMLAYVKDNGSGDLADADLVIKGSENKIRKSVDDEEEHSVTEGDEVNYKATVEYPYYSPDAVEKTFNVTDTLTNGTFKADSLVITIDGSAESLVAGTDYTVNEYANTTSLNIDFSEKYNSNYAGKQVTIMYTAIVGAGDGDVVNNIVTNFDTTGDSVTVDKVSVKVIKHDQEDNLLGDATFTLYEVSETEKEGYTKKENVKVMEAGKIIDKETVWIKKVAEETTSTQDADKGTLTFAGLDSQKLYYVQETNAPSGYKVDDTYYKLEGSKETTPEGSKVYSFTDFNDITVKDTNLSALPSTGGIGTTIFTIGGCLIMIIAAALFFASRRKENK